LMNAENQTTAAPSPKRADLLPLSGTDNRDERKPEPTETIHNFGGFEVILSKDKFKCWVKMSKTDEGVMPDKAELLDVLEEHKIEKDLINEEELNRIFNEYVFERVVLIAEGKSRKDGANAFVKYFFKTDLSEHLKEDDKGRIDFKEINLIQNVKQGEVVAELVPPEKGTDGITVTGEIIKAKDGNPANLPVGLNTEISKSNPNKLIATLEGSVTLKRNKVNVDPVVVIEGDVDFSTGNVNYKGAVVIKGDIKAGFTVKSEGDVTVNGVVEDAVIETEGSVILKSGFVGRGTGRITAGGDVILPFAENQNIYSRENVIVSDALLHCNIEADGRVVVSGDKGVIGGSIFAHDSIEVQRAGSQTYIKTVLGVGTKHETRGKMEQFKVDSNNNKTDIDKVDKAVQLLDKIRLLKSTLPPKQQQLHNSLLIAKEKLLKEEKALAKTKEELDEKFGYLENAVIRINQQIHPGVIIEIGNLNKVVQEEMGSVSFKIKDKDITELKETE